MRRKILITALTLACLAGMAYGETRERFVDGSGNVLTHDYGFIQVYDKGEQQNLLTYGTNSVTANAPFTASSTFTASGTLAASGNVTVGTNLVVSGATTTATFRATGASTLSGDVTMSGSATVATNITVSGATTTATFRATGASTLSGDVTMSGSATVATNLTVSGATTTATFRATGASTLSGDVAMSGSATVATNLTVSGATTTATFRATGASTLSGDVTMSGSATVATNLTVSGVATAATLVVNTDATFPAGVVDVDDVALANTSLLVGGANGTGTTVLAEQTTDGTVSGVASVSERFGEVHMSLFTFTNVSLTLNDGSDRGASAKVYDAPEGVILVLATVADCTTIASAGMTNQYVMSFGTTAAGATDPVLTGTEVDIGPSATIDTGAGVYTNDFDSVLATSAIFDGTATAKDIYINAACSNTAMNANWTNTVTGTLKLWWVDVGDN